MLKGGPTMSGRFSGPKCIERFTDLLALLFSFALPESSGIDLRWRNLRYTAQLISEEFTGRFEFLSRLIDSGMKSNVPFEVDDIREHFESIGGSSTEEALGVTLQ